MRGLYKKFTDLKIRTKIISSVTIIVFLISAITYFYFLGQQEEQVNRAFQEKSENLAEAVSLGIGIGLGTDNYAIIGEVFKFAKQDPDLMFIAVLDMENETIAEHNPDNLNVNSKEIVISGKSVTFDSRLHVPSMVEYEGDKYGSVLLVLNLTRLEDTMNQLRYKALMISGLFILLGFIVGAFISNLISKPILQVVAVMKDIAEGEGDLTKRLNIETQDEVGELARWFDTFVANLHEIIYAIKTNTQEVTSAVAEIAAAAEEALTGAGEQEAQAGEVSSSIEQMAATIVESSQNASLATDSARNAAEAASEGGKVVQKTIEGMQEIAETVKASAATIGELGKRSDEIGEIISVIDDIADQTNLLALNAAIEAARAGEQGRGFAVVADEVRKLAERTTKATAEIASMIEGIQKDTSDAVSSMEEGTSQVETGTELAIKAGDSLNSIVSVVSEVQHMIEQIATASDEQSAAAEQISGNIGNIASVTKQSAQGAEQMASTAERLNRQTDALNELVNKFKLDDKKSESAA